MSTYTDFINNPDSDSIIHSVLTDINGCKNIDTLNLMINAMDYIISSADDNIGCGNIIVLPREDIVMMDVINYEVLIDTTEGEETLSFYDFLVLFAGKPCMTLSKAIYDKTEELLKP